MGFIFPLPAGAFYLFAPLGKDLVAKILQKGVVIVPGNAFGCNAPDYKKSSLVVIGITKTYTLERYFPPWHYVRQLR
jgi:aspartate aminotransferase